MRILKTMLKQRGVYWAPTEADGNGQVGFESPVELKMRWQEGLEEKISRAGTDLVATVCCFVQVELLQGGVLWLAPKATWKVPGAALAAVVDPGNPLANAGALYIASFINTPTLRKPEEAVMVALM